VEEVVVSVVLIEVEGVVTVSDVADVRVVEVEGAELFWVVLSTLCDVVVEVLVVVAERPLVEELIVSKVVVVRLIVVEVEVLD
jgi:hypothetical protein